MNSRNDYTTLKKKKIRNYISTIESLDFSSVFHFHQYLFQAIVDNSKYTNSDCDLCHLHVPLLFRSQARSRYLPIVSHSFIFIQWSDGTVTSIRSQNLFVLIISSRFCLLADTVWLFLYLKVPENIVHLIFQDRFWFVYLSFFCMTFYTELCQR